jgi:putative membrane protein
VDQTEWKALTDEIVMAARQHRLADGLVTAVHRAGALLREHFPRRPDDKNEIPNRVVEI